MEKSLYTYLNDHLAGAIFAIDLIENTQRANQETPLGVFLTGLLADIEEDRQVASDLLVQIGGTPSKAKMASSWIAEKVSRLKLEGEDEEFTRLEELEILLLGIRGKLALWDSLEQIQELDGRLQMTDLRALQERARHQLEGVEKHRLEAARRALAPERRNKETPPPA